MKAPETTVVRIRRKGGEVIQGSDVYIGRAQTQGGWNLPTTIYANPYTTKKHGDQCLVLYRLYLNRLIKTDPNQWIGNLYNLHGKSLGCWCKPGPCHGDILKEYADQVKILYDEDVKSGDSKCPRINAFINSLVTV